MSPLRAARNELLKAAVAYDETTSEPQGSMEPLREARERLHAAVLVYKREKLLMHGASPS